ncbi:MAG: protein kinase, partial [Lentisphaeria bacterium]|nr:protein kinase [Lentisphaeria bacterium]
MFSSILDCPECEHRFNFEHDDGTFPEIISCPACGISRGYREFSALLFCPGCRTKIKVPLDMVFDENIRCPKCNAAFNTGQNLLDDDYGSTLDGIGNCTASKRVLQDGDIFDKYRIISLLGRGGMAEVYLAEHLLLKQLCALKLMRDNHAADDKMYVKRFLREARLLHRLSHPNIVKVYDAGNDFKTGYFFIAMEYVEGQTLLQIANEQKLDESYLEIVLVSMVNALKCLNEANVVHRDIKPSNIMLDKNGVFRLMDLGIAKSESNHPAGEMTLTMEQSTMGTPSYASPEQCQSAHSVDIRSDIYSLGATLYHAASGKLPYDGTTAVEIILKVIRGEREPLKNLRPDLSAGFLDLIDRMMLKDPSARPASPDEILSLLQKESGGAAGKVTGILGSGTKKLLQL